MKSPLVSFLLLLLTALPARALERVEASRWRRVKTYSMSELKQLDPPPLYQIVGVRFNYRYSKILQYKPSWYSCSIWTARHAQTREDFDYVPVMVAKADLPSFQALPSDPTSSRTQIVYGQVLKDVQTSYTFLRLLGTKVKGNSRGAVLVGW